MQQIIPIIKTNLLDVYKLSYLLRHPLAYPYFIFKYDYSSGKKIKTPDKVLRVDLARLTSAQQQSTAGPETIKASTYIKYLFFCGGGVEGNIHFSE